MTQQSIRPMGPADIATLQAIDSAAHGEPWSQRTFLDDVELTDRFHLVSEIDGLVIGHAAAWIDERSCRITNVAVAADHAGRGHATALLLAVVDQVLADHRVANMQLEVRTANRRAQRMYSRFGFVPVGVERDFYDRADEHGSRDALVMMVADVCSDTWRARLDAIKAEQSERHAEAGAAI